MSNGLPVCVVPGCSGHYPEICSDGAGGAVIAWGRNPTGTDQNIYVHRVLANGTLAPDWPPKGTPATRAPGDQYLTDIAPDGTGGAFVAWYDYGAFFATGVDVYAQHVLGNGQIAAGWPADGLPLSLALGDQFDPRLLSDGAGGVFAIWQDGSGISAGDIRAQHLSASGTRMAGWPEGGLGVCTAQGVQVAPYLTADGQGGFIAVWTDGRNIYTGEIFAQRITWSGEVAAGWPPDGKRLVGSSTSGGIRGVVPDGGGGAYIGWQYWRDPNSSEADVYVIRILADGSTAPGWPASGYPVCVLPDTQLLTGMVADSTGGVLLTWYDYRSHPGSVVYVERLRPDGTLAPGWQENGNPACDLAGYQDMFLRSLAPDGLGGAYVVFLVTAGAGDHGYIQHLAAGGMPALGWPSSGVPLVVPTIFFAFQQQEFAITPDGGAGAIVAWNDTRVQNGTIFTEQIYAQRYYGLGPTPVLVALVSFEALPDRVALTWHDPSRTLSGADVYRHREGEAWAALGRASFDGTGRLQFEDRNVAPGERYAYRLGWTEAGGEQFSTETWVDVPVALTLALEGARPNPAVGSLNVVFSLARAERATLELLDVAGRQILGEDVGALGAGQHLIRFGECGCTPPGMYWLRLTQAGQALVRRVAVVR